ncbi:hypothetical protein SKAU_G00385220 [Synaphobranchus kaupii]|uniref:C2H2-type domain-containing protein n=1 Tax=Synaphobranchus kaupii TaxID=118154 RepID=A0A9Q1EEI3_SYNKA|nr:hypothetical protein SKAU_G00385220 [Synaphobranchus kaupii]
MSTCVAFHTRLTSIMDQLTKAAVAEICGLVDDGYSLLHLELTRSKKEIEGLKRKLQLMEPRIVRGSGEGTGHSGGEAPICSERKLDEGPCATAEGEFSIGCRMSVGVWRDGEPSSLDKETTPVQSPGSKQSVHMEESLEMIIIKKEGLDEDVETRDPQRGLHVNEERAVELDGGESSPIANTQTAPAVGTEQLAEQHSTRHSVWEDSTQNPVLKAEPEDETINLQRTGPELNTGRLNSLDNDQKENEALKRKLRMMELRAARGSWDRRRAAESHLKRLSSGVQGCGEFGGTAPKRGFSIRCPAGVNLWADKEPPTVVEEDSSMCEKSAHIEEERPETQTIKKEGLDEDVQASDTHGGPKFNEETPVESGCEIVDAQTEPTVGTDELTEQKGTRHRVWEDSEPDTVLKAEPEHETVNLQDTAERLNSVENGQRENEVLKRKLQMMELRISRRCTEKPRARIRNEIIVTASDDAEFPAEERVGNPLDISVWKEGEPANVTVDVEDATIKYDGCTDKEERRPESLVIKMEKLEEDLESGDPRRGLLSEERAVVPGGKRASIAEPETAPAIGAEELTEQHSTGHSLWEDGGLDAVLKAEPGNGTIDLRDTVCEHAAGKQNSLEEHVMYKRPGQLDTFYMRGFAEKETAGAACSYAPAGDSASFPGCSDLGPALSAGNGEVLPAWSKEPASEVAHAQHRRYKQDRRREGLQPGNAPFPPPRAQEDTGSNPGGPDVNRWAPCDDRFAKSKSAKAPYRVGTRRKLFICTYCGKSLACLKNLKTHLRVHTGEKPFSCAQCGKRFADSSNLKRHQSVHTGERKYGCTHCGKRFAQSGSLKVHQSVHTGHRQYICAQCGKTFISSSHLKRHVTVHAEEQF